MIRKSVTANNWKLLPYVAEPLTLAVAQRLSRVPVFRGFFPGLLRTFDSHIDDPLL